jgi:hypothetical protein
VDTKHIKADLEKIVPTKASDNAPGRDPTTKRLTRIRRSTNIMSEMIVTVGKRHIPHK